jgi:hypothetical protein
MNGELGVYLGVASVILGVVSQARAVTDPVEFIVGAGFIAAGVLVILDAAGAW